MKTRIYDSMKQATVQGIKMNLETVDVAAARLGVTPNTVRNWIKETVEKREDFIQKLETLNANVNEKFQSLDQRLSKLESSSTQLQTFNKAWWKFW